MAEPSNAHAEKRGFIRMQVNTPAAINIETAGKQEQGLCLNLSGSGMLLEVNQPFTEGSEVTVHLSSKHGHSPSIEAACTITRCLKESDNKYQLGLVIDRIL